MQRQPLPRWVDVRKLASAGAEVQAVEPVGHFPRFVAGLSSEAGEVTVDLRFFQGDRGLYRVSGQLATRVEAICQRCMQPVSLPVESSFELALVLGESQLSSVPKELDAVLLESDQAELLPLIEDELIVSMPIVAYHNEADCAGSSRSSFPAEDAGEEQAEERDNPFAVLKNLKSSDKRD